MSQLSSINHIVVLMLENRSFDHMLGFLYSDSGNKSPAGQPFEGLTGSESNPDGSGKAVPVFKIAAADSNAYFMPGADPGEGYTATNSQLFNATKAPVPPLETNSGFVTDYAYTLGWQSKEKGWSILPGTVAKDIMGMLRPMVQLSPHRNAAQPRVRLRRNVARTHGRQDEDLHRAQHLRPADQ
jgi:phospholipase C